MKMKGIFVNSTQGTDYARAIVTGRKTIETRNRDMLKDLVGDTVAVIRTYNGKRPKVIGYASIVDHFFCDADLFQMLRGQHLVPEGSKYDCTDRGKHCYVIGFCEECDPFDLPASAVRHGRSWCEYDDPSWVELKAIWE